MNPTTIEIIGASLFAIAVLHTFSVKFFEKLAHSQPNHAGLWHLLGEVEAVFGFWALILILFMFYYLGFDEAVKYADTRNYTEPMFVFAIMVIAASKPILVLAGRLVRFLAAVAPVDRQVAYFFVCLSIVPLLGSFITEPAAMTLAALLLRDRFYSQGISERLKYATLGVLFVNISIGGTLTPFAAPPVLMVAAKWEWDIGFMISHIGWRSALAVSFNALVLTWIGQRWLRTLPLNIQVADQKFHGKKVPVSVTLIHIIFLATAVAFHHYPVVFMGLFLFFLGYTAAYPMYQTRLMLREALLVAFFLAGLVVLGGLQAWWLQDLLTGLTPMMLFFSATALTAITDNAAITYLGSLVEGTDAAFRYALVTGALAGGGLTVIANAPNPAGYSLLKECFPDKAIAATQLFLWALAPTLVAVAAFLLIP